MMLLYYVMVVLALARLLDLNAMASSPLGARPADLRRRPRVDEESKESFLHILLPSRRSEPLEACPTALQAQLGASELPF